MTHTSAESASWCVSSALVSWRVTSPRVPPTCRGALVERLRCRTPPCCACALPVSTAERNRPPPGTTTRCSWSRCRRLHEGYVSMETFVRAARAKAASLICSRWVKLHLRVRVCKRKAWLAWRISTSQRSTSAMSCSVKLSSNSSTSWGKRPTVSFCLHQLSRNDLQFSQLP